MSSEIIKALTELAQSKGLSSDDLMEVLKNGIFIAVTKHMDGADNIEVEIDRKEQEIKVYKIMTVVRNVQDELSEISVRDALREDPKVMLGDQIKVEFSLESLGRGAIQTARQIILQSINDMSRNRIFEDFSKKVGDLVTGVIQQFERGNMLIRLGKEEAFLPIEEQIPMQRFKRGDNIKALIMEVNQGGKGHQIILSRTHPDFLKRLFEIEVNEIYEGIVEIKKVVRDPGKGAIVSVVSFDPKIEAVGACVGIRGFRVENIKRELGGEKIQVVHYNDEPAIYIREAMKNVKTIDVILDEVNHSAKVIVKDEDHSKAIGINGSNASLVARLTGWNINIITESEFLNSGTQKAEEI